MTASLDKLRMPSSPRAVMDGWTPAHSEAAWFIGKCLGVGALLGMVTEVARPLVVKRHA